MPRKKTAFGKGKGKGTNRTGGEKRAAPGKRPRRPDGPYIRPPARPSYHEVLVRIATSRWKQIKQWAEEDGLDPEDLIQSWVATMFLVTGANDGRCECPASARREQRQLVR